MSESPKVAAPVNPPAPDPVVCLDCLPRGPEDDKPFTGCGCDACDSKAVEIRCQAAGMKARADYISANADGPSPESSETARLAYGRARYAVTQVVKDQRSRLDNVLHELSCMIDDDTKIKSLRSSSDKIGERLAKCTPKGCCIKSCEFFPDVDCPLDDLVSKIARYGQVTEQADGCFARLAAEPDALHERVNAVVQEIDAILATFHPAPAPAASPVPALIPSAAPAATPATDATDAPPATGAPPAAPSAAPALDLVQLYVTGLNVRWHLESVWWSYSDVDDFVECLCRAMSVSMGGHEALAVLTGELAVRGARWQERNDCCRRLREHAVDEVIERYVRGLEQADGDRDRDHGRDGDRDHGRDGDRDRDRDHGRDWDHDRDRDRDHDHGRDGDRDRDRGRDGDRDRDRGRDGDRDHDYGRDGGGDRDPEDRQGDRG